LTAGQWAPAQLEKAIVTRSPAGATLDYKY